MLQNRSELDGGHNPVHLKHEQETEDYNTDACTSNSKDYRSSSNEWSNYDDDQSSYVSGDDYYRFSQAQSERITDTSFELNRSIANSDQFTSSDMDELMQKWLSEDTTNSITL